MKASYKIALALSVAVCILAVFLIKGDKQPDPTDTNTEIAQADAAPTARKTLRSDYAGKPTSPGSPSTSTDGSVKSMVRDDTPKSPSTIASDARKRILAAQGSGNTDTNAKQTADKPDTQAKSKPLNIGNNTTGPIALARTEAEKPEANKPTPPPTTVSNKAVLDILDSPSNNTDRPGATTGTTSNSNTASTTTASANPVATTDKENTYIIQPGDTFSSIAIDVYNDEGRWVDIAQANSLVDPTRLKVGQVLRMPGEKQLLSKEEPSPPGPGGIQTHTIRAGDSLSTVADKYYGDPTLWRTIYNFNRDKIGDNPNAIQAGMTLKVPPKLTGAQ